MTIRKHIIAPDALAFIAEHEAAVRQRAQRDEARQAARERPAVTPAAAVAGDSPGAVYARREYQRHLAANGIDANNATARHEDDGMGDIGASTISVNAAPKPAPAEPSQGQRIAARAWRTDARRRGLSSEKADAEALKHFGTLG